MKDTQSELDQRGVAIDSVGVSGLRWPIVVWDQKREKQPTVATLKLTVALPEHFEGTHMSRFIEVLDEHRGEVTFRTLPQLVAGLRKRLSARSDPRIDWFRVNVENHERIHNHAAFAEVEWRRG
jgi:GTP cyclohydrolase I